MSIHRRTSRWEHVNVHVGVWNVRLQLHPQEALVSLLGATLLVLLRTCSSHPYKDRNDLWGVQRATF